MIGTVGPAPGGFDFDEGWKIANQLKVDAVDEHYYSPPEWFLNLEKDPAVTVQVKDDKFAAHARVATAEEKPEMWRLMTEVWPDYDEYQKKTDREIPVVVLERT